MNKYINIIFTCIAFGVVDRIENNYATIEINGHENMTISLPVSLLPELTLEGDSLCLVNNDSQSLQILQKKENKK